MLYHPHAKRIQTRHSFPSHMALLSWQHKNIKRFLLDHICDLSCPASCFRWWPTSYIGGQICRAHRPRPSLNVAKLKHILKNEGDIRRWCHLFFFLAEAQSCFPDLIYYCTLETIHPLFLDIIRVILFCFYKKYSSSLRPCRLQNQTYLCD